MNRKLFKVQCVLMALVLTLSGLSLIAAASEPEARLYRVYGDRMLFQQNKDIILAGTAAPGTSITCELIQDGQVIRSGSSTAEADGTFEVTMPGVAGGYSEYDIVCKADGTVFKTLQNVVFGELWLASGQSNMQMSMNQSLEGKGLIENNQLGSQWVRYLLVPGQPEYNDSANNIPLNPQNDVSGAVWCDGTQNAAQGASAVGFFFAEKLQAEIGMPVGLISAALGGTSIYTWLSRQAIENNTAVLNDTKQIGVYYSASQWKEAKQNTFQDITCNYNNKIHPLRNFRPAGMIWYQGESNIGLEYGFYTRAFELMQDSYSSLFGYESGERLPIVHTQLASFDYGDNKTALPQMQLEFAEIQKADPASRAMTTIYDVPLTYHPDIHAIHPLCKGPVGEKMATAALGFIYGESDTYTAPYVRSYEIADGSVYVSFNNVGDGLTVKQSNTYSTPDPIYGCTIAGDDGVFVEADAEIVAPDTIRIYNPEIPDPAAATYAYSETNTTANLFSTKDGEIVFGVAPFTTERLANASHLQSLDWTNCEIQSRWHCNGNVFSGDYATWQAKNAAVSFTEQGAYKGTASLKLDATAEKFTALPTMIYLDDDGLYKTFDDLDTDYSRFKTISFMIKNIGTEPIKLSSFNIYTSANLWFSPKVENEAGMSVTVAPDGEWHKVTLELDTLYLFGRNNGFLGNRYDLKTVYKLELCFEGENASVLLDDFTFSPSDTEAKYNPANLGSAFRYVFKAIQAIIDFFAKAKYFLNNLGN